MKDVYVRFVITTWKTVQDATVWLKMTTSEKQVIQKNAMTSNMETTKMMPTRMRNSIILTLKNALNVEMMLTGMAPSTNAHNVVGVAKLKRLC